MTTADFYAQTALQYGQCEIEKGMILYSPAGIKAHAKDADFDPTAADYWITHRGYLIEMHGTENITDYQNGGLVHRRACRRRGFVHKQGRNK